MRKSQRCRREKEYAGSKPVRRSSDWRTLPRSQVFRDKKVTSDLGEKD